MIEQSNAWMEHCKILVKNSERTLSNAKPKSDALVKLASVERNFTKTGNPGNPFS